MSRIDELKEEIGAIKSYLGFVVAFIITIGAGIIKLYLDEELGLMLLLGLAGIFILVFIFSLLAQVMHKKIKLL